MPRLRTLVFLATFALTTRAQTTPPRKLPVGTTAPALDFHLLDGSRAPVWKTLKGQVVIVDFWASWCAPCVASIPHLDALRDELAGQPVRIYSITYEPKGKVEYFLKEHPMRTAVAIDDDLKTFESFIAWGIPMAYVVGPDGRVAAVVNPKNLNAALVRDVLGGKPVDPDPHPGWNDPAGAAKYFREQMMEDRKKWESVKK